MTGAATDLQDLYRELILDHSRSPRHFGRLDDPTHTAHGINPLCGDKLKLYLLISDDGTIESTSFEGSGCAISIASASLMTAAVTGIRADEADSYVEEVTTRLTAADVIEDISPRLDKLVALDGVREFPGRVKCATLAWHALHSALHNETTPATTE
ncbi:MAG TPA: SUF system NifU family Fe-S cluster assembly protein [Woeseiaceae bacterium]|jgi:nitrogen fixation NifU-like protein|nr:SUF system NifU family Fe-S cluster assembly protein [Woeseiaceae bacterium]